MGSLRTGPMRTNFRIVFLPFFISFFLRSRVVVCSAIVHFRLTFSLVLLALIPFFSILFSLYLLYFWRLSPHTLVYLFFNDFASMTFFFSFFVDRQQCLT